MQIFEEVLFFKLCTTEKQKNKQLIQLILCRMGGWQKELGTRLTQSLLRQVHCTDFLDVGQFIKPQLYVSDSVLKNAFWSLLRFLGNSTRKPASIVCDDERDNFAFLQAHTGTCISHS